MKIETIKLMEDIAPKMTYQKKTVSVAESCTGGLLGAYLTYLPGSSAYFDGGVQTYSNAAKTSMLGLDEGLINKFGAVSEEVAKAMVVNVKRRFGTDFGLSITGIAGPDGGSNKKPVGTVWIALSYEVAVDAIVFHFGGDRQEVREQSCYEALKLLDKYL